MKKTFTIGVFLFSLVFFANGANAEYDFYYFNDFESCSTPGTFYNCDNNWTSYDGNSAETYEMPGGSFSGTKFVGGVKGNIYETAPLLEGSFSFMLKMNGTNFESFFVGNRTGNNWNRLAGFSISGTYCSSDVFSKYGLSGQYGTAYRVNTEQKVCRWERLAFLILGKNGLLSGKTKVVAYIYE